MPSASRPFTTELVDPTREPRRRHHADHAPHRRVVAGGARGPVPRAVRRPGGDGPPRRRRPPRRPSGHRRSAPPSCGRWSPRWTPAADRCRRRAGPSGSCHPEEPTQVVDGLITGWHEPRSSHLRLLEAVAGLAGAGARLRPGHPPPLPLARVRRPPPDPPGLTARHPQRPGVGVRSSATMGSRWERSPWRGTRARCSSSCTTRRCHRSSATCARAAGTRPSPRT